MSLGGVVCYYVPVLELAVEVRFSEELEFSQSHISPYFTVTSCRVSKRSSISTVLQYPKYFRIKNLRKRHTEHDIMSTRCSTGKNSQYLLDPSGSQWAPNAG